MRCVDSPLYEGLHACNYGPPSAQPDPAPTRPRSDSWPERLRLLILDNDAGASAVLVR